MPKTRPEQLGAKLKKSLASIYLISGDETLLVQESCDLVRHAARAGGFADRDLHHVDRHFKWQDLLASANSMSLFADKKIIELRIENGKPGTEGSKALVEYCQTMSDENLLLVVTPKLDRGAQNSKWVKSLESFGEHVQIWPVTADQLPRWINERMKTAGLTADRDAISVLVDRVEGNLLAAQQEIEKLKLLSNGTHIDLDTMVNAVADNARYNIYELVDRALAGEPVKAAKILKGLQAEGAEALWLLSVLSREIRTLLQVKHGLDRGQQLDWAMKNAGVWDKRRLIVNQAQQRFSSRQLQLLLRKAAAIDKAVKGMRQADVNEELMDLVVSLSGVPIFSAKVQRENLI